MFSFNELNVLVLYPCASIWLMVIRKVWLERVFWERAVSFLFTWINGKSSYLFVVNFLWITSQVQPLRPLYSDTWTNEQLYGKISESSKFLEKKEKNLLDLQQIFRNNFWCHFKCRYDIEPIFARLWHVSTFICT